MILNSKELSKLLNIGESTIYRWTRGVKWIGMNGNKKAVGKLKYRKNHENGHPVYRTFDTNDVIEFLFNNDMKEKISLFEQFLATTEVEL